MKITITEALAEVKTIGKRVEKKRQFVTQYMLRQEQVKDPLEKDGGSVTAIKKEMQGIGDLQERQIRIRSAIQLSNLTTTLKIGETSRSITDWLTWKKDVAPGAAQTIQSIRTGIEATRTQMRMKGVAVGVAEKPTDVVVNVDEAGLAKEAERLEETLGVLDGKLSLLNATTLVDITD